MTRSIRLAAASLFLIFLFQTQPSSARQEPKPQQPAQPPSAEDVVRITTQLVQIDAVVTDRKGEHIDTLGEEDFELTVDGKRQTLTFFKVVKQPELKRPDKLENAAGSKPAVPAAPMPAKAIAPEEVKRTIAFVMDDLGLSFESTYYARQAIKKFVDEQMQEGDLVGVIRTGRGAGSFQQFTTDKRVLYAAIEKLQWNPYSRDMIPRFSSPDDDLAARTGGADDTAGRDASERFEDFRETVFSVGTLGALNFVVRGLRELPGRKTAILVSDGFRLFGRNRDNNQVLEQVRRLTDLANRSSVVIYSLDAKGLQTLAPTAADSGGGNLTGPQFAERLQQMSQQNFDSQEGLSFLARETGGFAVLNNNDLNLGIQRALKDQRSYYLIGFDPDDEKFDQRYHSIKLKVARPGLQVRTRAGFIGRPDTGARPEPPRTRDAQILSALFSPFGARDLSMQMTSFFFNTPNPNRKLKNDPETISFVRSLFNIDMSKLTYKDEPDGKKSVRLAIINFTFNENGVVIEQHGREFTMPLDAAMIPIALSKGLNYTDDFVIKKPGAYQFRAVIRDAETGKLGSAGQFIQVPDLSKNRLALSGLILTAPPEERNAQLPDDVQPTPTVRRFPRSGSIDYGGMVYNPAHDPQTGKPQLKMTVEIYRDGKPIYQAQPRSIEPGEPGEPGDDAKPKRLQYGGRLKLTSLAPGDYLLHVIIEDPLAKKKFSRADQWMDFSVK
ncbi:MAG: VWA domain-containing protein [Blastocatellia bacterium]